MQEAFRNHNIKLIPKEYDKISCIGKRISLNQGRNEARIRSVEVGEHVESSRLAQATVTSSNIVGQVTKLNTADNIGQLDLTAEMDATETVLDNFQLYDDSAALRVEWVKTGLNADLEEAIVSPNDSSTKSARFPLKILANEWVNTISSLDLENQQIQFDYIQTVSGLLGKFEFFIGDGTNTKSIEVSPAFAAVWDTLSVLESDMKDDEATTPDVTAITKIGFRVSDSSNNQFFYIDNLVYSQGTGSVILKLFDMGDTKPVSASTTIDSGTQYTTLGDLGIKGSTSSTVTLSLKPGKNIYKVEDFCAGAAREHPDNNLLTQGNYYIFTINYVDVDVIVWGPDEVNFNEIDYYEDGFAFSAANEAATITALGEAKHISFIYTTAVTSYITALGVKFYDENGAETVSDIASEVKAYLESREMEISAHPLISGNGMGTFSVDISSSPELMEPGSKIECYYNSAPGDSAKSLLILSEYRTKGTGI